MNQTEVFTNILERVFNSGSFFKGPSSSPFDKRFSSIPLDKGIVGPYDTGPTTPPFYLRTASTPINKAPFSGPIDKGSTVSPIYKGPTVTPSTVRPMFPKWPTTRQRWELKPPDNEVKRPTHVPANTVSGRSLNLENFLWVALGGFVVLVLMAIFMKIGNPIRRVRRQLSNARSAPNMITRRQDPNDRNLDMGSLLRLTDTDATAGAPYDDLPPAYSECVYTNKHDTEEPPPRFDACFVTYTTTKDTEPKVHIQRQNVIFEDDSFAMNDSEDVDGIRTELVLVNGRIVERPKLDLSSHNNETKVASNDNVKESRHVYLKGRVVYYNDATDHVKVNMY